MHTKVYRAKQPHERDQSRLIVDELIENKALRQVLKLVNDKISKVNGHWAVKWYVGARKWRCAVIPVIVRINALHPDVNTTEPPLFHNYLDDFLQAVRVFGFLGRPVSKLFVMHHSIVITHFM